MDPETNTPAPVEAAAPVAPVAETPVTEIPVTETPATAETQDTTTVEPTILGEEPPKETVETPVDEQKAEKPKTDSEAKTEDTTKTEEGQSEEPAPPPVYEDFTVPEGVTLDAAQVKEFTTLLSELELEGKTNHELVQKFGQKAVDFHIAQVKQAIENVTKLYQQTWENQKTQWKENFLKDPEIGGNRFQTTVDAARSFIKAHGGSEEQQAEFRSLMETTGLGNHPAMIRLLANAGRKMSEGKPLAAPAPAPQPKSRVATLYGGMKS
jgi:hypothetical protein